MKIDFDKIKSVYRLARNLRFSDAQILINSSKFRSFAPGDFIMEAGTMKKDVFFIHKGLIRVFALNDKGDEITTMIKKEHQLIANLDLILYNQPSTLFYETLEPTEVSYMDYDVLQSILARNPKLDANRKYFFQHIVKQAMQRINTFVLLSPEERYIDFMEKNPDLINRVPDKYIAHILGITPVSLSRIRKRILIKKA